MTDRDDEDPRDLRVLVEASIGGGWAIARVTGEVDVYNAGALREQLMELADGEHRCIAVDLRGTTSIDSTGLGVLVRVHRRAHAHGRVFEVIVDQEHILKVLRITSLSRVLTIRHVEPDTSRAVVLGAVPTPFRGSVRTAPRLPG